MTQFYDVHNNLATGQFVLRAELPVIALIYRWSRPAEERIKKAGTESTVMYGNGRHEDIVVTPVMTDWVPDARRI